MEYYNDNTERDFYKSKRKSRRRKHGLSKRLMRYEPLLSNCTGRHVSIIIGGVAVRYIGNDFSTAVAAVARIVIKKSPKIHEMKPSFISFFLLCTPSRIPNFFPWKSYTEIAFV